MKLPILVFFLFAGLLALTEGKLKGQRSGEIDSDSSESSEELSNDLRQFQDPEEDQVAETFEAPAPPHIHGKFAYVTWSKDKGYEIKIFAVGYGEPIENDWVAKARYQNLVNKTGWGFLEVETKASWPDEMQMTAAGLAEGYLTKDLIYYTYKNLVEHYCDDKAKACNMIDKYVNDSVSWMVQKMEKSKNTVPTWHQFDLLFKQYYGVYDGYQRAAKGTYMASLTENDFAYISLLGDLGDLEEALVGSRSKSTDDISSLKWSIKDGHCSSLIKLKKGANDKYTDIYSGHVSWFKYQSMLRLIKRYNFPVHTTAAKDAPTVPGVSIVMSSYPGVINSFDDFYITSNNLMVTETTISNYNKELWKRINPKMLFTGDRAMIANRLATGGESWTKIFGKYNSGTYNNQWMVLDYNVFEPNKELPDKDLLWVLEQMPGMIVAKDMTSVLKSQGYWASYNSPYFKEIFEASGSPKMVEKFGDFFSYENTPRAKIFARDQNKVDDLESMMKMMRYNDFQNDPLSKCDCSPPYSAENAISSRCDLNPKNGTYPFEQLGHRSSGATDMKVTSLDLLLLQQFIAIGGPTYDPLPVFQWSTSDFKDLPHYGMPDRFEFDPIIHQWKWL